MLATDDTVTAQEGAMSTNTPPAPLVGSAALGLRAHEDEGVCEYIALRYLCLDSRNVRKEEPAEAEINQLADLIASQGLLQNLVVVAYPEPKKDGRKRKASGGASAGRGFTHGVVAGGRRYRALLALVKRGQITLDEEILCTVLSEDRAIAASVAENSGRSALSTPETVMAFVEMAKAGAGVEELAVAFGLSVLTVQRRLRLGNVAPSLFAQYRQGAMNLEQLMALALTDDHAAQIAAWEAGPTWNRSPHALRQSLTNGEVSRAVLNFVGMEAYEAAGGPVLADLFAESEACPRYVADPALMNRLAHEKLEREAASLRAKGVAWVDAVAAFTHEARAAYVNAPLFDLEPTGETAQQVAALTQEADALDAKIDAAEETGEGWTDELQALEDSRQRIDDAMDAIRESLRVPAPELKPHVGAVVSLDRDGKLQVSPHLMRRSDAPILLAFLARVRGGDEGEPGATTNAARAEQIEGKGLSESLCRRLTAHRSRGLQVMMLRNPALATAAVLHPLLLRVVYDYAEYRGALSALDCAARSSEAALQNAAPDLAESRATVELDEAITKTRALLPSDPADLFAWLLEQPTEGLVPLFALCGALSINAIAAKPGPLPADALAQALKLDMAEFWEPTAGSFLGAVPKAEIAKALADAGMADDAKTIASMKKADAVKKAETLLAGKRWLPPVLR